MPATQSDSQAHAPTPVLAEPTAAVPASKASPANAAPTVNAKAKATPKDVVAQTAATAVRKPAADTATKATAKPAVKPTAPKLLKTKKPKLVRDSFTIPKLEYLVLEELKARAVTLAYPVKKTELIRAGIKALAAMTDNSFLTALKAVPVIKTGRPTKD